jgi:hypothetical protein
VRDRAIAREIELDGDALPASVGMERDQVARNIAGEHRYRKYAGLGVVGSEAALERGREPPHERVTHFAGAQRAAYDVPERTLRRWEVPDVFGEQIDLHPRVGAVGQIVALAEETKATNVLRQPQGDYGRDKGRATNPANRALVADGREISSKQGMRGGPGRTQTSNQAVMRAATAGKVSVIFATPAHVLPTVVLVW